MHEVFVLLLMRTFHSRLKTSLLIYNFHLDLENALHLGPLLCGSLEIFILD